MTRMLTALVALALLLPSAAAAQAPQTNAPPGNSAIDEYLETVPSATGNKPPPHPGQGGEKTGALTPAQRKQLDALGPDGRELAAVVDATGSAPARGATTGGGTAAGRAVETSTGDVSGAQARSPLRAALSAAVGPHDGEGMGALLPVILLTSLLGVMAIAVLRRRPLR
jgi:hypothetical protein